jgi:hypothetical protein
VTLANSAESKSGQLLFGNSIIPIFATNCAAVCRAISELDFNTPKHYIRKKKQLTVDQKTK